MRGKELREGGVTSLGPFHGTIDWLRKAQHQVPAARSMLARLMWRNIVRLQYPEEPVDLLESVSPPAIVGTSFTGSTGYQDPTRWRADGSSPCPRCD